MAFLSVGEYQPRAARITDVIASTKKIPLKTMVTQNKVFSIPRLAVKTPPASAPVILPRPAPLLCRIILKTRAIDVKIKAPSKILVIYKPPEFLAVKLYLCCDETVK